MRAGAGFMPAVFRFIGVKSLMFEEASLTG
jgi:hypothetical protein